MQIAVRAASERGLSRNAQNRLKHSVGLFTEWLGHETATVDLSLARCSQRWIL